MKLLYKQRLTSHLKEMMKYLRLVFNDYFLLALLFLIGGLGLSYSNLLAGLNGHEWWLLPVAILVLTISANLGSIASLVEEPDFVFLLPREGQMNEYLRPAFWYSAGLAGLIQIVMTIIVFPLISATHALTGVTGLISLIVLMLVLKTGALLTNIYSFYRIDNQAGRQFGLWLVPVITLVVGMYFNFWLALVIAVIIVGGMLGWRQRQINTAALNWNKMIKIESSRMHRIYQFFNLFTDVPMVKGSIKRRRLLQPLLNRIKLSPDNTYRYLYAHGIIRDNEMSGLYTRLTTLGAILLYLIQGQYLPIIISALFLYLIGFQLIPFYFHYEDNVFVHIYPIDKSNQNNSFAKIIEKLLMLTAVIFAIVVIMANLGSLTTIAGVIIVELLEIAWFIKLYLPGRIKKSEFNR